ncbi:MAG: hypothetical protein WCP46_09705 [Alphaproteobacteria bacterium]
MKSVVILLWVLFAIQGTNAATKNGEGTQSSEIKETNEFTEVSLEEEPKQAPNPKNYGTYKPRAVNNATDEECVGCCVVQ